MKKTLTCVDCRVEFTYDHRKGPTRQRCDSCTAQRKALTTAAKSRRYRERDPDRAREQWNRSNRKRLADPEHLRWKREDALRRAYGITRAEFDVLVEKQGNLCAICHGERNGPGTVLHVDHCHTTGRVRGLLCSNCNRALGMFGDDPVRLRAAADYLEKGTPHG